MTSAGLKAVVLMALLFVGALLAWLLSGGVTHTTTRMREHTTVLIEPQQTPLRDSGPKNNARPRGSARQGTAGGAAYGQGRSSPVNPDTQNRPLSAPKTQRPKATHKPSNGQHAPNPPAQPSNPPPTQTQPVVGVTVPAPVSVCARPLVGVNC